MQLALLHVGGRTAVTASPLVVGEMRTRPCGEARGLYISATPSESALRFIAQGARLAAPPDPDLLALEPEDVHLILALDGPCAALTALRGPTAPDRPDAALTA